MKCIILKIKLHLPSNTPILHQISDCVERFLKRRGLPFEKIDCYVKLEEDE